MTDLPQPAGQTMPPSAAAPGVLDGIKPGSSTSEFKLSAFVIGVVQAAYAAFISLTGTGTIHVPDYWVAIVTAIDAAVSGGIVASYTKSRTDIKVAASANLR